MFPAHLARLAGKIAANPNRPTALASTQGAHSPQFCEIVQSIARLANDQHKINMAHRDSQRTPSKCSQPARAGTSGLVTTRDRSILAIIESLSADHGFHLWKEYGRSCCGIGAPVWGELALTKNCGLRITSKSQPPRRITKIPLSSRKVIFSRGICIQPRAS